MKRFLVSILVPASAAIAVVGSGFSVWYFGDKEVKSTTNATLNVENMLHVGEITKSLNDLTLKFDQTKEGRKAALELKGNENDGLADLETTGITLFGATNDDMKIVYTLPTEPSVDHGDFGGQTVKTEIKTAVKISDDLSKWLTVSTSDTVKSENGAFVYTWADAVENATTRELDLTGIFAFTYAPSNGQYTTADRGSFGTCEPLNADEYSTMRTALSALPKDAISIVTTATIVKVQ